MSKVAPLGAIAVATAALLAGCTAAPAAGILDAENDGHGMNQLVGVPVPDGQIDRAVEQLDDLATSLLEETGVPGFAVAVVHEGETVFAKGYGVREVGGSAEIDTDTVFQLASMSKSIGATVVARQVGEGGIDWDTPVVEYLPWFELNDPWVTDRVTVGDLYSHRSGLPEHAGDQLEVIGYDRTEVLERLRQVPLSPFRGQNLYTNFGLTAGAEAVAAASGTDWATLSERALYDPLGMTKTSSRYADFAAQQNRAVSHTLTADGWEALYQRQPDAQSPAGGVSSSVTDIAAWMTMMLDEGEFHGETIIDEEALRRATSPQSITGIAGTPDSRVPSYGYGFNLGVQPSGRVAFSHSGAFTHGVATAFTLIPSLDLGIAVLTNGIPIGVPEILTTEFTDLAQFGAISADWRTIVPPVFEAIMAPEGELVGMDAPADASLVRDATEYAGSYANDYFGPLTITADDGGLTLSLGPADWTAHLEPWEGDVLVFAPPADSATPGSISKAVFETDGAGSVASVTLEFFNENGLGTFDRTAG